jgi:hypothetical protein
VASPELSLQVLRYASSNARLRVVTTLVILYISLGNKTFRKLKKVPSALRFKTCCAIPTAPSLPSSPIPTAVS